MGDPISDGEREPEGDFELAGDLDETDPDQAPEELDPGLTPDPDSVEALDQLDSGDDLEHPATVLPGGFINPATEEDDRGDQ